MSHRSAIFSHVYGAKRPTTPKTHPTNSLAMQTANSSFEIFADLSFLSLNFSRCKSEADVTATFLGLILSNVKMSLIKILK